MSQQIASGHSKASLMSSLLSPPNQHTTSRVKCKLSERDEEFLEIDLDKTVENIGQGTQLCGFLFLQLQKKIGFFSKGDWLKLVRTSRTKADLLVLESTCGPSMQCSIEASNFAITATTPPPLSDETPATPPTFNSE